MGTGQGLAISRIGTNASGLEETMTDVANGGSVSPPGLECGISEKPKHEIAEHPTHERAGEKSHEFRIASMDAFMAMRYKLGSYIEENLSPPATYEVASTRPRGEYHVNFQDPSGDPQANPLVSGGTGRADKVSADKNNAA